MNNTKQIGEIIRKARGDVSLRNFANKCGISHTYLDDIEKGYDHNTKKEISITIETLKKLSIATGLSVNYLLFYTDDPKKITSAELAEVLKSFETDDEKIQFTLDTLFAGREPEDRDATVRKILAQVVAELENKGK